MPLTFPLALDVFADQLPMVSAPFQLDEQQELSGLGSGDILAADLAPQRWTVPVQLAPMRHLRARSIQALIESLRGAMNSFYLYSPSNCYPAADPGGTILGASTPTIHTIDAGNAAMRITGLPAGYILTRGDVLAFDYGSNPTRRALHRVLETVTASGAGLSPLFSVEPHIRPGATTGLAVILKKPAAKMIMVPGSLQIGHSPTHATISFQAIQKIP